MTRCDLVGCTNQGNHEVMTSCKPLSLAVGIVVCDYHKRKWFPDQ